MGFHGQGLDFPLQLLSAHFLKAPSGRSCPQTSLMSFPYAQIPLTAGPISQRASAKDLSPGAIPSQKALRTSLLPPAGPRMDHIFLASFRPPKLRSGWLHDQPINMAAFFSAPRILVLDTVIAVSWLETGKCRCWIKPVKAQGSSGLQLLLATPSIFSWAAIASPLSLVSG